MRSTEVVIGLTFVSLVALPACNRADTDENARRAREEIRELAGRAGDRFADSWVVTKIQAQYFADGDVKARQIDVSARDGIVTLTGHVDSDRAREQAVGIARATDGVMQVEDQLVVGTDASMTAQQQASSPAGDQPTGTTGIDPAGPGMPLDDESVSTRIQAKFFRDGALKSRYIDVATDGGIVTLRGTVANDNERAQARLLAWTTHGVQRVEDVLTVDPSLGQSSPPVATPAVPGPSPSAVSQDASIEQRVRELLQGDSQTAGATITVTAKDGVLLLEGTVPNTLAKQRALALAREADGVVQVVDRIRVGQAR